MQVSFGKLIQAKVYLDGKPAEQDATKDITNLLCRVLRKDKSGTLKTSREEELRDLFERNVSDYKKIKEQDKFYNKSKTPKANVTSVNIADLGTGRFLVTGEDIASVARIGNDYRYNTSRGRSIIYNESHYYPNRPKEETAKAYNAVLAGASVAHKGDLKGLFHTHGLEGILEIRAKSAQSTNSKNKSNNTQPYEQLSLFSLENTKADSQEKAPGIPLHKLYTIESINFAPNVQMAQEI